MLRLLVECYDRALSKWNGTQVRWRSRSALNFIVSLLEQQGKSYGGISHLQALKYLDGSFLTSKGRSGRG